MDLLSVLDSTEALGHIVWRRWFELWAEWNVSCENLYSFILLATSVRNVLVLDCIKRESSRFPGFLRSSLRAY